MKYFYALAFFVFSLNQTHAQSNYKPGYVVTLKGDTIPGSVNYQEWIYNPSKILFKATDAKNARSITPDEFLAFEVKGYEKYFSYTGKVSMDNTTLDRQRERDTSFVNKSIFLKVIRSGPNVTLYTYTDDVKTRFFLKELGNSVPFELNYHIFDNGNHTVTEKLFTKQLFGEAEKFNVTGEDNLSKIQNAAYTQESLQQVVDILNHNLSRSATNANVKSSYFFIGAGINVATFKTNPLQSHLAGSNTSSLPFISGGVDVLANPTTGRLIFRIEALATQNKFLSNFNAINGSIYAYHYAFTQLAISLMPQVVYNVYNTEKLKFYISPGAQISSLSYSDENYHENFSGSNTPIARQFVYSNFLITGMIKAGIKVNNRFDIAVSYQLPQVMTTSNDDGVKVSSIYGGLHYYIGK